MIRCSNVHMPVEMSHQNAFATAFEPAAALCNPAASTFATPKGNAVVWHGAGRAPVELIGRCADVAKIAKSVIQRIMIDVVNNVRLLVVSKKPSNAVGKIALSLKENDSIAGTAFYRSCYRASTTASATDFICDDSSFRVIAKAITNRISDNFVSHVVPPYDVVRGVGSSNYRYPRLYHICPNGGTDPVITREGRWFFNLITLERAE